MLVSLEAAFALLGISGAFVVTFLKQRTGKEKSMGDDGHSSLEIKTTVKSFLSQSVLPFARTTSYGDDDSFLEKGLLDSTGVLELVGFVEREFTIRVEADELTPDNLDSVNKLVAFVEKKTGLAAS
jgi:acyl carrier protein